MKWMGGWGWLEYCQCPPDHRDEIIKMINEEAEEMGNQ